MVHNKIPEHPGGVAGRADANELAQSPNYASTLKDSTLISFNDLVLDAALERMQLQTITLETHVKSVTFDFAQGHEHPVYPKK